MVIAIVRGRRYLVIDYSYMVSARSCEVYYININKEGK